MVVCRAGVAAAWPRMSYCSPAAVIKYTPPFCPINAKTSEASSGSFKRGLSTPAKKKKKRDPLKTGLLNRGNRETSVFPQRVREERLHTGGFGVFLINVKMNRRIKSSRGFGRLTPGSTWTCTDNREVVGRWGGGQDGRWPRGGSALVSQ